MAKLTDVYRAEDVVNVGYRQIPVVAGSVNDSSLMMLMDLNSKGLCIDCPQIRSRDLEEFTRKYKLLTAEELQTSLEIDSSTFVSLLNQSVPCVGCRRRVERLFYQLTLSGHPTLDPLVLKSSCILTVREDKICSPQTLGTLLYRHHEILNNLLDSKVRNKTRCVLHSLDAFRTRPFSEVWREVWFSMKHNCRDQLCFIAITELHEVLENYLKKHKFCQGCRTKIEKAYQILVNETASKEGFDAALYANIRRPQSDKHIQVITKKTDFLDALIRRAEPEVNGSYSKQRERHAKTLEIAQEEVLTCVGMIMYERLRGIYVSLREEERACQVLAAVGVHALSRSFDMAVERKQGISNLELLYQEISRSERAKEIRREQKKLKKKLKKLEKKEKIQRKSESGDSDTFEVDDDDVDEAVDMGDELNEELHKLVDIMDKNLVIEEVNLPTIEGEPEQVERPVLKKRKVKKSKQKKHKQPQVGGSKKKQALKQPIGQQPSIDVCDCCEPANHVENCDVCLAPQDLCPCENDQKDLGYGSELHSSDHSRISSAICTPEGSEVSCSDGFCNHDNGSNDGSELLMDDESNSLNVDSDLSRGLSFDSSCSSNWLSLQQMLDNFDEYEDDENCYIPQEVVMEYQCKRESVKQQRQQLRETLWQNFARLCNKKGGVFNTA